MMVHLAPPASTVKRSTAVTSPTALDKAEGRSILGRPVHHIGYAVESIPQAVDFLMTTAGAGPFFLMADIRIPVLRNANGPIIWEHSAAFGQWGDVAVELQEVHRLEPADALGASYQRTNGINHVAYVTDDLDAERARLEAMGLPFLFEASNGPHDSLLFDAPLLGHTIEVHRPFPMFDEFWSSLAVAAGSWDGQDPLRPAPRELQETLANTNL